MINSLIADIPQHQYVYVRGNFVSKKSDLIPAVWFGITSFPNRAWGLNLLLECGAVYRNVPPHGISFDITSKDDGWNIHKSQLWNCYGYDFSVLKYNYLSDLKCRAKISNDELILGTYLFSVAPIGDGFSATPEQAKEFCFIKLDNMRLTIQPTNNVIFEERSFTNNPSLEFPNYLKVQREVFEVEK